MPKNNRPESHTGISTLKVAFFYVFYGAIACSFGYGWYEDSGEWWLLAVIGVLLLVVFAVLFRVRCGKCKAVVAYL